MHQRLELSAMSVSQGPLMVRHRSHLTHAPMEATARSNSTGRTRRSRYSLIVFPKDGCTSSELRGPAPSARSKRVSHCVHATSQSLSSINTCLSAYCSDYTIVDSDKKESCMSQVAIKDDLAEVHGRALLVAQAEGPRSPQRSANPT